MKATTSYLDQLTTNAPRVEIIKSDIVNKNYNDITIKNVDFTGVKIENTAFNDCLFSNCTFTKVDIINVDIRKCKFINCKFANIKCLPPFTDAISDTIKILNSEIICCNFYKLRCDTLFLCESYITDSVFDHITLRDATIHDSNFTRDRIKKLITCYSQSEQFTDTNVVAEGILTANEKNRNGRSYSSSVLFSPLTAPRTLELLEKGYLHIYNNTFTALLMERSEISRLDYNSNIMYNSDINIILDGMPAYVLVINNSTFVDSDIYAHILNAETRNNTIINGDVKVYFYNCNCRDQFYNNAIVASDVKLSGYANIKELSSNRCPQEGSFIGYKKVISDPIYRKEYIAVLEIPEDAKRSSAFNKKCRCSKAKVIRFEDLEGNTVDIESAVSMVGCSFKYTINKMVYPDSFDDNWQDECSNGIHFFINKHEARDYTGGGFIGIRIHSHIRTSII